MEPIRTKKSSSGEALAWIAVGVAAFVSVYCSGCSSEGEAEPDAVQAPSDDTDKPHAAEGCDAIELAPPKRGEGIQVSIDMPLAAGEERQICKLVVADEKVNLNWAEGIYSHGSHHGLTARTMYRDALPTENVRGETVDASQVATCESLTSDWEVLGIVGSGHPVAGNPATGLNPKGTLPKDVALKIDAGEVLIVNLHMINVTEKPIHACYKQNLYGIPDAQVKREAGTMFYYNSFITVPGHSRSTAKMACPISQNVSLAAQVSHMHKRGVGYTATLLDGDPLGGGAAVKTLYEGSAWEEPVVKVNSPAESLSVGQWIQWECDYQNDEDRNVSQGQQTTDEMCMFRATYWPRSAEMDWCMAPGSTDLYSASRLLADGGMDGAEFLACWNASPQKISDGSEEERFASQRCFTESCARVSGRVNEFSAGVLDPNGVGCE